MGSEHGASLPTVDLSPFFHAGDELGRKKATEEIGRACQTYGFFRIINHGVSTELMDRALQLSRTFFDLSDEEKLASKPVTGSKSILPAGYTRQPEKSPDKNEYLLLFSPNVGCNVYPADPPEFRPILDEIFTRLTGTGQLIEDILGDCMGLPRNFFKDLSKEQSSSFMTALRYSPATVEENNGISEHEDGSIITFVFQDDVGGLEVLKDGEWIPADPSEGSIIVNLGDVVQVLSNNKFKSAMHRVVRKSEKYRHSFAFFFNADGDKWIEPLPEFTTAIGETPRYRSFLYRDYLQLRMRNKTDPPERPEDIIHVSHYALASSKLISVQVMLQCMSNDCIRKLHS